MLTPIPTQVPDQCLSDLEVQVRTLLTNLGTNALSVADSLTVEGPYLGVMGNPESCPVANYLAAKFPGNSWLTVGNDLIDLKVDAQRVIIPIPSPIAEFVQKFDNERYPWLIQQSTPDHPDEE